MTYTGKQHVTGKQKALRDALEAQIEALIALLDVMDGDPDLEASCDDDGDDHDREFSNGGFKYEFDAADHGDLSHADCLDQRRIRHGLEPMA